MQIEMEKKFDNAEPSSQKIRVLTDEQSAEAAGGALTEEQKNRIKDKMESFHDRNRESVGK